MRGRNVGLDLKERKPIFLDPGLLHIFELLKNIGAHKPKEFQNMCVYKTPMRGCDNTAVG